MQIVINNKSLENELLEKSKELKIKVSDLIEKILSDKLKEEKDKVNSFNTSHIKLVDDKEREEILNIMKNVSKEDREIDKSYTKIFEI